MLDFLLSLLKNPKALFINGILTKWYILVMVPAITAAYYVFYNLYKIGLLQQIEEFIVKNLSMVVHIARDCTPKIIKIQEFLSCF